MSDFFRCQIAPCILASLPYCIVVSDGLLPALLQQMRVDFRHAGEDGQVKIVRVGHLSSLGLPIPMAPYLALLLAPCLEIALAVRTGIVALNNYAIVLVLSIETWISDGRGIVFRISLVSLLLLLILFFVTTSSGRTN